MKNSTKMIIIIVSVFLFIGIYVLINSRINYVYNPTYNVDDFYTIPDRKMLINEYKNVTVRDDDMAKKYFNSFFGMVFDDTEKSYDLLEDDYKEEYYPTYGKYLAYIKTITSDFSKYPRMSKYKKNKSDKEISYVVLDENNNKYIFIVEAVMKYKIKFSED